MKRNIIFIILNLINWGFSESVDLEKQGPLFSEKYEYDLGSIMHYEKQNHTFKIKNKGNEKIIIREIRSLCSGCSNVNNYDKEINAGEDGEIKVTASFFNKIGKVNISFLVSYTYKSKLYFQNLKLSSKNVIREYTPAFIDLGDISSTYNLNKTIDINAIQEDKIETKINKEGLIKTSKIKYNEKTKQFQINIIFKESPLPLIGLKKESIKIFKNDKMIGCVDIRMVIKSQIYISSSIINLPLKEEDDICRSIRIEPGSVKEFKINKIEYPKEYIKKIEIIPCNKDIGGYQIFLVDISNFKKLHNKKIYIYTNIKGMEKIPFTLKQKNES